MNKVTRAPIIYIAAYAEGTLHGGGKRTAQVREMINSLGEDQPVEEICIPQMAVSFIGKMLYAFRGLFWNLGVLRYVRSIRGFAGICALTGYVLPYRNRGIKLVVFEYGGSNSFLAIQAIKKALHPARIVSLPQNVESLVPGNRSAVSNRYFFCEEEVLATRCADYIFSISRVDHQVLSIFKNEYVNTLTYFPSQADRLWLTEVRSTRESSSQKSGVCLLGSAGNLPTRIGIEKSLVMLAHSSALMEDRVAVVGVGALKVKIPAEISAHVDVHDSIPQPVLRELFCRCKCIVIYRPPTTGCLTRVVECLLAGIPILVNSEGAGVWAGHNGVFLYADDFSDFHDQLGGIMNSYQQTPELPRVDAGEFLALLDALRA